MINLLINVAAFASVKLAFLWIFTSERKTSNHASQASGEDPYFLESRDKPIQASALLSGNRLPRSAGLVWIDLSIRAHHSGEGKEEQLWRL